MNLNMKCRLVCAENITSVAAVCVRVTRWGYVSHPAATPIVAWEKKKKKKPAKYCPVMGRHWFHLVATCMDSTGNFYRLTQFFFKYPLFRPLDSLPSFSLPPSNLPS